MLSEPPPSVKHDERVAPHSTWLNAVKNLRSSQMALKERAAAVKTSAWAGIGTGTVQRIANELT